MSADEYYLTKPPGNEFIFVFFSTSGARDPRRHKTADAMKVWCERNIRSSQLEFYRLVITGWAVGAHRVSFCIAGSGRLSRKPDRLSWPLD